MEGSKTATLHKRIETRKSKLAEIKQKLKNKSYKKNSIKLIKS